MRNAQWWIEKKAVKEFAVFFFTIENSTDNTKTLKKVLTSGKMCVILHINNTDNTRVKAEK
jgi:hypothetical protein